MLPRAKDLNNSEPTDELPEFFLVFRSEAADGSGELSCDEAAKGFLPEGLFPRLLKKAAAWYQQTGRRSKGGRKPVMCKQYAELSFGPVHFAVELLEAEQMIRVKLLVQNPTLVVARMEQFVEEIKNECIPSLEYFIAIRIAGETPEGDILLSLQKVEDVGSTDELWVGKGRAQRRLEADCFRLWCPPAVEDAYDIFISYRQASDTEFARKLYDCLAKFAYGDEGRRLRVFLDSKRLLGGLSWKEGFVEGLKKSTIMVPIVSKGALEPMAQLDPTNGKDWCDNVLLEWKLGLNLIKGKDFPLQAIYPVVVGSEDPDTGRPQNFFKEAAQVQLSAAASRATDDELVRVLPGSQETVGAGIAATKTRLLEQLGVLTWDPKQTHGVDFDASSEEWNVHEGCAHQIFKVLCERGASVTAPSASPLSQTLAKSKSKSKKDFRTSAVSSSDAILMEGPLLKRSSGAYKRWQKRCFAVAGHYLKYANTEEAVRDSPKATIDLNALTSCGLKGTFLRLHFADGVSLELQVEATEAAEAWHERVPIRTWLTSVNPNLGEYAEAFASYGYNDTELLRDAEEDDLVEAFDELGVKKPHRKRVLLGFRMLKA
eukprot:g1818.t1